MRTLAILAAIALSQPAYAVCGDLVLESGEQCDDGNTKSGDGCSATCVFDAGVLGLCSTGEDGPLVVKQETVVNGYYPPAADETTVAAGARLLPVGAVRGDATPLQVGDRLLIVQVQGVDIDAGPAETLKGGTYGDGTPKKPVTDNDRAGHTGQNLIAGQYEVAFVAGPVDKKGNVPLYGFGKDGGLRHSYVSSRTVDTDSGFRTWQAVRVPAYSTVDILDAYIVPEPWNGRTGGFVAFDVLETLTMNGGGINASGRGFRGGQAASSANGDHDSPGFPGFKGEGIAGTALQVFESSSSTFVTLPAPGYPTPSDAGGGAPANGGGNGWQSLDAGGGGGGHAGYGGVGGQGGIDGEYPGRGGAPVNGPGYFDLDPSRLFLGGGGGGASGDDKMPNPEAGSGGSGGGVIWVRAADVSVGSEGAEILTNGGAQRTATSEGGGGGGAGGSILLVTDEADLTGLDLEANGSEGNVSDQNLDGAGGGGGGGVVYVAQSLNATGEALAGEGGGVGRTFQGNTGNPGTAGLVDLNAQVFEDFDCDFEDTDTDGDGLLDGEENKLGTDPLDPDSDDDCLSDGEEVNIYGTDPLDPDTDDGGALDGPEVFQDLDPLDKSDDGKIATGTKSDCSPVDTDTGTTTMTDGTDTTDGGGTDGTDTTDGPTGDTGVPAGRYLGGACTGCHNGPSSLPWFGLVAGLLFLRRRRA